MNAKLTITANLLAATLLTGCGGGGGGGGGSTPAPVAYFNVDFIKLYAMSNSTTTNCQIFGYDDAENPGSKVIGYEATSDSDEYSFSIVIHNADGSVAHTFTSANWGASSTHYRFRQSLVPSDGYVSFVRKLSAGGVDSFDATTFSKEMLPTNFDLAVRRTTASGGSCILANTISSVDRNSYIANASTAQQYYYGFNTYNQDLSDLTGYYANLGTNSTPLSFSTLSNKQVLAVRYGNSSDTINYLQAFKILSLSELSDYSFSSPIVLDDVTYSDLDWTAPTDVDTLSEANMYIYQQGTGALLWQPLSANDESYSYSSQISDDNYFVNMAGIRNDWNFEHTEAMTTPDISHDSSTSMSSVNLPASEALSIESCSTSDLGTCLVTSSDPTAHDDTIQRLLVTVSAGGNSATQVIYSAYNTSVPVMSFDDSIDGLWSGNTAAKYEISLLHTDADDLEEAFTFGHLNAYPLTSGGINSVDFADRLPLLSSVQQQEAYQDELKYQPHTWLSASF
ncbi:hypothetical protein [Vibrio sp. ABG19]|uniref:hypothetical protein n=1 Tax=Vibrio sp. ABG19 TaxID=2817385 RepID=UPI00249F8AC8|nr:hypothetical protein [Vibrio sp. ABG19]WGY46501.1 hypothetical protein J0X00_16985 [Vibrio sp. ABG19]